MADEIEKLQTLAKKLGELAESLGLHMHTFAFLPNVEGTGPHHVQGMFELDGNFAQAITTGDELEDGIQLSDEERLMFENLARDTTRADEQAEADEAAAKVADLARRLQEGTLGE